MNLKIAKKPVSGHLKAEPTATEPKRNVIPDM